MRNGWLLVRHSTSNGAEYITSICRTGKFLIIGQTVYSRD